MNATTTDIRKSDKWIPYLLIPFFAVIFIVNGIFLYFALTTHAGVVSEEAYKEGLAYNNVLEQAARMKAMSLRENVVYKDGQIKWSLADATGTPIANADISAKFIRAVHDGYDFELVLQNNGKGVYSAPVKAPLPGAWVVKLDAKWDNQHYQTTKRLTLP